MQHIFNSLIKNGITAPALEAWSLNHWKAREILIIYFKYTIVKEQKEILFYFLVSFGDLDKWKNCLESPWHFSDQDMVKNNAPHVPKRPQPRGTLTEEQSEGREAMWHFAPEVARCICVQPVTCTPPSVLALVPHPWSPANPLVTAKSEQSRPGRCKQSKARQQAFFRMQWRQKGEKTLKS